MSGRARDGLRELAAQLREERTPISAHVAASPPPAAGSPVVEAVREGYLLHYGDPRLLAGHDEDLALLAGDYLYALGIERLAAAGDVESVLVLADLIGACAQLHAEDRPDEALAAWDAAIERLPSRLKVP
jgi:hypothetical protein